MEEIVIKEIVSGLMKQFTDPIYKSLKTLAKDSYIKIQVVLESCFSEYLERNYERYSKSKTLLYRQAPVNLKDFYVRTDLRCGGEVIEEKDFISTIEKNKRIVIVGDGGSGKSSFCRSIFIDLVENSKGFFPILIELRHLNDFGGKALDDFILFSMNNADKSLKAQHLEYALELGKVIFILDGFDEIKEENRRFYEREILNISNKYNKIKILVSSRVQDRFSSWEEFYQYELLALDKKKAIQLIQKLDYDLHVKNAFLRELENNLYNSHNSFASNPLLLTMMLLTYDQISEIPNKLHLFYEQAFLTLFHKHDSLKSSFKRHSFSGLPLDQFRKCMEAFCIYSYCEKTPFFKENIINLYIEKAIAISNVNTTIENFLTDLLESYCLLQRDGMGFSFTHRSFQEYFAAQFLVHSSIENKYDLFDKVFLINPNDSVLKMIYDMNSELLEKEWIVPKINKIYDLIEELLKHEGFEIRILSEVYTSIYAEQGGKN